MGKRRTQEKGKEKRVKEKKITTTSSVTLFCYLRKVF